MFAARRSLVALAALALLASAVVSQTNPNSTYPNRPGVMRDGAPVGDPSRQMSTVPMPPPSYANPQYAPPPPPVYAGPAYPFGLGYGAGIGMLGAGPGVGYGTALQGLGSYTQAQGQYWKDIESARMSRENVKQKQIDTNRKEVEWEMEYEKLRPTTQKMVRSERAAELQWARNDAPLSEIWSGKTLNVLLRSILDTPHPSAGPNIPLEPHVVNALNLTDQTTRANLSLTKDNGRIDWTETLQEKPFDEARNSFQKNFDKGIQSIASGEALNRTQRQELQGDLAKLEQKLDDMTRDITMDQYIGSRRVLNQLKDTLNGMGNARVVRSCSQAWRKEVHNVAALVNHCLRNGLSFGPAVASADEPAYTAAYYAIRNYERSLVGTAAASMTR